MSGLANTSIAVIDQSVSNPAGLEGVSGVLGITERGPLAKPTLVRSWTEFKRHFGGFVDYSDFPLYCWRALQYGAPLLVSRVAHYTDISDDGTIVGTKATGTITVSSDSVVITAKNIGSWGNGITVTTVAAASGTANKVDITVKLTGYSELDQTVFDVSNDPDATERANLNKKLVLVDIADPTGVIPVGSVTLTTGDEDYSGIVSADYIGNATSGLGLNAFDDEPSPVRICAFEEYGSTFEVALRDYALLRKDFLGILRTPGNIDGDEAVNFRNKTGTYSSGTVIDTWRCRLFWGDITVYDPLIEQDKDIHCIGDVIGLMGRRDNETKPWLAVAGATRGVIRDTRGVVYNIGTAARKTEADDVIRAGIDAIIQNEYGTLIWSNNTLQKKATLLQNGNVAELVIHLQNNLDSITKFETFEPNDLDTWRKVHRKVVDFMETVKTGRGVHDYKYEGDQDVDNIVNASINSSATIANNEYRFNLHIKPVGAIQFMVIGVVVNNVDTVFEL